MDGESLGTSLPPLFIALCGRDHEISYRCNRRTRAICSVGHFGEAFLGLDEAPGPANGSKGSLWALSCQRLRYFSELRRSFDTGKPLASLLVKSLALFSHDFGEVVCARSTPIISNSLDSLLDAGPAVSESVACAGIAGC